jgi:hypothetical protein
VDPDCHFWALNLTSATAHCTETPEVDHAEWMGLVVGYLQIIARLLRDILTRLEER